MLSRHKANRITWVSATVTRFLCGVTALNPLLSSFPTPSPSIKSGTAAAFLGRVLLGLTHSTELPVAQPKKDSCHKLLSCFPSFSLFLLGFLGTGLLAGVRTNIRHAAAVLAQLENISVGNPEEQMQPSKPVWTACTSLSMPKVVPSSSATCDGHHALQTDGHEH